MTWNDIKIWDFTRILKRLGVLDESDEIILDDDLMKHWKHYGWL
jgi:hypothetical protein